MTNACELRFDFVGWTASRLGVSRDEVETAVGKHAATTAATKHGHSKQERRDAWQEPHQRRTRQKRLVCA